MEQLDLFPNLKFFLHSLFMFNSRQMYVQLEKQTQYGEIYFDFSVLHDGWVLIWD